MDLHRILWVMMYLLNSAISSNEENGYTGRLV